LKLWTKFKGIAIPQLNQGSSILMWQDVWNNGVRSLQMPELFSFTLKPDISIKEALEVDDLHNILNLPLSE
jgi:hypothetical protein